MVVAAAWRRDNRIPAQSSRGSHALQHGLVHLANMGAGSQ
jgi:hypothetical protein